MSRRLRAHDVLRACALRLGVGWLLFSALGFLHGEAVLRACVPALSAMVRLIAPELASHVVISTANAAPEIVLEATVARPLVLDATHAVPTGQPVPARANVIHALVPLVIFCTALVALPLRGPREWTIGALLAIPLGLAILLATTPYQLVGLIEMAVHERALALGVEHAVPWSLTWMLFLEGGGRWVLPIAFALVAFALIRRLAGRAEQ